MKPLTRIKLIDLTEDTNKLIESVKYLMDYHPEIRERIEFDSKYTCLRYLEPIEELLKRCAR